MASQIVRKCDKRQFYSLKSALITLKGLASLPSPGPLYLVIMMRERKHAGGVKLVKSDAGCADRKGTAGRGRSITLLRLPSWQGIRGSGY